MGIYQVYTWDIYSKYMGRWWVSSWGCIRGIFWLSLTPSWCGLNGDKLGKLPPWENMFHPCGSTSPFPGWKQQMWNVTKPKNSMVYPYVPNDGCNSRCPTILTNPYHGKSNAQNPLSSLLCWLVKNGFPGSWILIIPNKSKPSNNHQITII